MCLRIKLASCPRLKGIYVLGNFLLDVGETPIRTLTKPSTFIFDDAYDEKEIAKTCLEFLRIAPNLKGFVIEVFGRARSLPLPTNQSIVVLPHLRQLNLGDASATGLIINQLYTPTLEDLLFCTDHARGSQCFVDFIRRSLPPLMFLDLVGLDCADEIHLLEALRFLPAICEMRVLSAFMGRFMEEFTIWDTSASSPGQDIIRPVLERLWLSDITAEFRKEHDAIAAICSMIVSRWMLTDSFTTIALVDFELVDVTRVKDQVAMQHCPEEGLDYFTPYIGWDS